MNKSSLILFCLIFILGCCAVAVGAAEVKKVAVLDLRDEVGISDAEMNYLTDTVRGVASQTLPSAYFNIITKESIYELLPPGTDYAKCFSGECEVEVGRKIGADYLITGELLKFGKDIRIVLKVHHSQSARFLGQRIAKAANLELIEQELKTISVQVMRIVQDDSGTIVGQVVPEGRIGETPRTTGYLPASDEALVKFESVPDGASVISGGEIICRSTPCSKNLPIGPMTVSMMKEKYFTEENYLDIRKNMPAVSWKLKPNFGWLTVTSSPSGLSVKINDKYSGFTPIIKRQVDPGPYEVLVSDPNYYDSGQRINVAVEEHRTVNVELDARWAQVKVRVIDKFGNAEEADVLIDGKKVGQSPGTFRVVAGEHDLLVRRGNEAWRDQIKLKEGDSLPVTAKLHPELKPDQFSGFIAGVRGGYGLPLWTSKVEFKRESSDELFVKEKTSNKIDIENDQLLTLTTHFGYRWEAFIIAANIGYLRDWFYIDNLSANTNQFVGGLLAEPLIFFGRHEVHFPVQLNILIGSLEVEHNGYFSGVGFEGSIGVGWRYYLVPEFGLGLIIQMGYIHNNFDNVGLDEDITHDNKYITWDSLPIMFMVQLPIRMIK